MNFWKFFSGWMPFKRNRNERNAPNEENLPPQVAPTNELSATTITLTIQDAEALAKLKQITIAQNPKQEFKSFQNIGSGCFGQVYKAINKETEEKVAIKRVKISDKNIWQIINEINLMKRLNHPNVVKYFQSYLTNNSVFIVMDYERNGSLKHLINHNVLNAFQIAIIVKEIVKGLIYLHDNFVIHQDLKCSNILIGENASIKIADFGLSADVSTNKMPKRYKTPFWMAPEMHYAISYSFNVDIWSLGIVICEIIERDKIGDFFKNFEFMSNIFMNGLPKIQNTALLTFQLEDFLKKCFIIFHSTRWNAKQCMNHPFLQNAGPIQAIAELIESKKIILKKK